ERVQGFAAAPTAGAPAQRMAAIDLFGPLIIARWNEWLQGRPVEEQARALQAIAGLDPAEAVEAVGKGLSQHAVREEARQVVREYLSAIPQTARDVLQSLAGTPTFTGAITDPRRLSRFLPVNAPPFPVGSEVPGTPYRLEELLGSGGFGAVYRAVNR